MRRRPTSREIDDQILDSAAGIFAVHGFAHASVQQIADAVGYSKAGLLHRFGSKAALYDAVIAKGAENVADLMRDLEAVTDGPRRLAEVLRLLTTTALQHPGMIQMLNRAFAPQADEPAGEAIQALGYELIGILDQPHNTVRDRVRTILALQVIVSAITLHVAAPGSALDLVLPDEQLVSLVVDAALAVLTGTPTSR